MEASTELIVLVCAVLCTIVGTASYYMREHYGLSFFCHFIASAMWLVELLTETQCSVCDGGDTTIYAHPWLAAGEVLLWSTSIIMMLASYDEFDGIEWD